MRIMFCMVALCAIAYGANYYVDFDAGSDAANGTSTETPWKHCPGDSNATDNAASATPVAGDSIKLKGGVVYRGKITIKSSGTVGNPITYTNYGIGRATVDASTIITGTWTRCSSTAECDTNPDYDSVWYTDLEDIPDAIAANLCEDDTMLIISQMRAPVEQLFYGKETNYLHPDTINKKFIIDDTLQYAGGSSLVGAILFYVLSNTTTESDKRITSFSFPDSISYDSITGTPLYGSSSRYNIGNKARWIRRGTYAVEEGSGTKRCWIWPNYGNPNNSVITYTKSNMTYCLYAINKQNIVISNINFLKACGKSTAQGIGLYIYGCKNITIDNCVSKFHAYYSYGGYGDFYLRQDTNCTISNSVAGPTKSGRGIYSSLSYNITYYKDTAFKTAQTSMTFHSTVRSKILRCYSYNCNGSHSNAISIYLACDTILIAWCKIVNESVGIALQRGNITTPLGGNMTLYSNLIDGNDVAANLIVSWSSDLTGTNRIINNTIVKSSTSSGIVLVDTLYNDSTISVNNITDGERVYSTKYHGHHEAFIGLLWTQQKNYGFHPRVGDIIDSSGNTYIAKSPDSCMVSHATGDYSINSSKLTYKSGTDITNLLPNYWPEVDFSYDIDGNARSLSDPSIGAYEGAATVNRKCRLIIR